jgi:hypothetical protein
MTPRYVLRFETGERQGEIVPLDAVAPGTAFRIGRKPGNSLQVVENSVSGLHAELVVGSEGVALRDLDSTNGTRVGGERVRSAQLRHGDEFSLGNVLFRLIDQSESAPVDAPALPSLTPRTAPTTMTGELPKPGGDRLARTQVQPREESLEITAADLARSRKGSRGGLIALGVLAVAGGAAWFLTQGARKEAGGAVARPITAPQGNLLPAYSFETEDGWEADGEAPAAFRTSSRARVSGQDGLLAELGEDVGDGSEGDPEPTPAAADAAPYALHRSEPVRVRSGSPLEVQVSVRTDGDARARIGLRFEGTAEVAPLPCEVWSDPIVSAEGHELFAFTAPVPPGFDRAAVMLAAEAPRGASGEVALDDASLVVADGSGAQGGAPRQVGQYQLTTLGTPPRAGALARLDNTQLTFSVAGEGTQGRSTIPFALEPDGSSFTLRADVAGVLELHVSPTMAGRGVATLGGGGTIAHNGSFERERATDVLLGQGGDLVRLRLVRGGAPREGTVRGVRVGDGLVVRVALAAGDTVAAQLSFEQELIEAQTLASRARQARRSGNLGGAYAAWSELLAKYPFEQALVTEAVTVRSELLGAGDLELRELTRELERARFFRLVDLYDELADRGLGIAQRYAGSEVESGALALVETLRAERSVLARDVERFERQRLEAIATFLEANDSPRLAAEVREQIAASAAGSAPDGGDR